jgi:hypothetical protein
MSARARLALDIGVFVALLVANDPSWTGLSAHEWLSLAIVMPLLLHLVVNWEWAVRVASRFAQRLRTVSRVNLVLDVTLFISAVAVMTSGFVVSRSIAGALGIRTSPNALWYALHSVSADSTIVLLVAHLALHWRWVARTLGLLPTAPARAFARSYALEPARVRSPYPGQPSPRSDGRP